MSHGSLTLNADGSFSYAPTTGYTGFDSFTYTACTPAPGSVCSSAVTVNLTVDNDGPTAVDDTYSVVQDDSLSVAAPGVLANDTDPNGDTLTVSLLTDVSHGSLTLNSDGSFDYTPTTGYVGPDSFTYEACDTESACDDATVSINVTQSPPVGLPDGYSVHKNLSLSVAAPGVLSNDTDPNGLTLHAVLDAGASHGTLTLFSDGSFDYSPVTGYAGSDSFTYTACTPAPGSVCSSPVTVTVTVINDGPTAVDDSFSAYVNSSLAQAAPGVLANDTDPNGDSLTASLLTDVSHGTLTLHADGSFDYTPATDYLGPDSFTYRACDPNSACSDATVSINVVEPAVPVASDDYAFAVPGTPIAIQVLLNDVAGSGSLDLSSLQVTGAASHGSTVVNGDGTITYSTAGGVASDSFDYRICNTLSPTCATATVYVTIDRAPTFGPGVDGSTISLVIGGSLPGAVDVTDPDSGDTVTLSYTGSLPPGLVLNPDGTWSGTTAGDTPGSFSITIHACDQFGLCTDADVTIVLGTSASPSPPTTTPPPTSIGAPERRAGDPPLFLVLVTLVFGLLAVMAVQTRAVRRPRVIPVSRRDGRRS